MPGPIGIIGGSGLYELIEDAEKQVVETPWGTPSSPVSLGRLAGRDVARSVCFDTESISTHAPLAGRDLLRP